MWPQGVFPTGVFPGGLFPHGGVAPSPSDPIDIDARNLASLIGYGMPFRISLPFPDVSIDQGDLQHLLGLYRLPLVGGGVVPPVPGAGEAIIWTGRTVTQIVWVGRTVTAIEWKGIMTVPFNQEVAVDSLLSIGPYSFTRGDGSILPLTDCVSVHCDLKLNGAAYSTIEAEFIGDKANGVAWLPMGTFEFPTTGVGQWTIQFVAVRADGKKHQGDEVVVGTKKNVRQLATNEVPTV